MQRAAPGAKMLQFRHKAPTLGRLPSVQRGATVAKPTLYCIHYSPWSEKARWALAVRQVAYRKFEFLPMIHTLRARAHSRRWSGKLTVPLLVADGQSYMDSFEIAQWAEQHGSGPSLFPPGQVEACAAWNRRSEVVSQNGRALVTPRIAADAAASREQVPGFLQWLGPAGLPVVSLGVRYLTGKYALSDGSETQRRAAMAAELQAARQALQGQEYLLGQFSIADIAVCCGLQMVEPVADQYLRLLPATRRCWRDPELAEQFGDILAWRDQIFARHHPRRSA